MLFLKKDYDNKSGSLKNSKNYKPKKPIVHAFLNYTNEEGDIVEEILKEHKNKLYQSGSTDIEGSGSDSEKANSIPTRKHSKILPSKNISIIVNETNNYITYLNPLQIPEKPIATNLSFSTYSDETLVRLSPFLIKEQNGSRYLQKKLINDVQFANESFFRYLTTEFSENEIIDLVCDQFGNYLFQSLLESLNFNNLITFTSLIKNSLYDICVNNYGTRVMQKYISIIAKKEALLKRFISIIQPLVLKLLNESHGNHIIQKYLEEVKTEEHKVFINKIIQSHFNKIATHKFGCCTIQKFLAESLPQEKRKNFELIKKNIHHIITNQYGSYIFQYIIEKEDKDFKLSLLKQILPNILKICKTKYSSNAIEKCFEFHCQEIQQLIIDTICDNNNNIKELIMDPFGNYIIQKALCVCDKKSYEQIISVIGNNTDKIKKLNFGYKLISKLLIHHKSLANYLITSKKE